MTLVADHVTGQTTTFHRRRIVDQMLGGQEGVLGAGDFKVTQRAAGGPGMFVDIAPGDAFVDIDSGVKSGRAHIDSDAVETRAVAPSHATLPRIDLVVLDYNDTAIPAGQGGGNVPTIRVLTGAPTAGVTLDAPGASPPALPNDALLLGMFLVPAASTSVVTGNIRDRRKFSRGFRRHLQRTAGDYTITSAPMVVIDPGNLTPRAECNGTNEFEITMRSRYLNTALALCSLVPAVDGNSFYGLAPWRDTPANTADHPIQVTFPFIPAAGSRVLGMMGSTASGSFTIAASGAAPLDLTVTEHVRQNADNT